MRLRTIAAAIGSCIALGTIVLTAQGSPADAAVAHRDAHLMRCETSISYAVEHGVNVLSGGSDYGIRAHCSHLTGRETRRAEKFAVWFTAYWSEP